MFFTISCKYFQSSTSKITITKTDVNKYVAPNAPKVENKIIIQTNTTTNNSGQLTRPAITQSQLVKKISTNNDNLTVVQNNVNQSVTAQNNVNQSVAVAPKSVKDFSVYLAQHIANKSKNSGN